MILLLHIIIALSTVGISGFALIKPTNKKLKASYIFTVGTFITGGYLVIMSPSHLVSACITGLFFLGAVGAMQIATRHKLAHEHNIT